MRREKVLHWPPQPCPLQQALPQPLPSLGTTHLCFLPGEPPLCPDRQIALTANTCKGGFGEGLTTRREAQLLLPTHSWGPHRHWPQDAWHRRLGAGYGHLHYCPGHVSTAKGEARPQASSSPARGVQKQRELRHEPRRAQLGKEPGGTPALSPASPTHSNSLLMHTSGVPGDSSGMWGPATPVENWQAPPAPGWHLAQFQLLQPLKSEPPAVFLPLPNNK